MQENIFSNIANQLYVRNYKIRGVDWFNYVDFIEANHSLMEFKGEIFYRNLVDAMPRIGMRIARRDQGETPTFQEIIFL